MIYRRFMLDTALVATHQSVQRHDEARARGDQRAVFIALAEAVYWACVLDTILLDDGSSYERERSQDWNGQVMPGITYARNLQTHALPMTVGIADIFTDTFLDMFGDFVWAAFDDLPEPERTSKYTPAQQEAYRTRLAGKATATTMHEIRSWFAHVQGQPWSPWGPLPEGTNAPAD